MIIELRNDYGFPIAAESESLSKVLLGFDLFAPVIVQPPAQQEGKFEKARKYAAEAKARNAPGCDCETCRMKELEPAVAQIVRNWQTP